jgi:hypothetical protein
MESLKRQDIFPAAYLVCRLQSATGKRKKMKNNSTLAKLPHSFPSIMHPPGMFTALKLNLCRLKQLRESIPRIAVPAIRTSNHMQMPEQTCCCSLRFMFQSHLVVDEQR